MGVRQDGRGLPLRARVAAAAGWSELIGYCRNGAERDSTHHEPCKVSWLGRPQPWEEERPLPSFERDWGVIGPLVERHGIAVGPAVEPGLWMAHLGQHHGRGHTAVLSVCAALIAAFGKPVPYRVLCRGLVVASGCVSEPHEFDLGHAEVPAGAAPGLVTG